MLIHNEAQIEQYFDLIKKGEIDDVFLQLLKYARDKHPEPFITHEAERDIGLGEKSATGRIAELQDVGLIKPIGKRKFRWISKKGKKKQSTVSVWLFVQNPKERKDLADRRYFGKFEKWKKYGWKRFSPLLVQIIERDFKKPDPEAGDQLKLL